jgi:hypothetical protein
MCQPKFGAVQSRVVLPNIFGFERYGVIVPNTSVVFAIFPDPELAEGDGSNVAPPSSEGE